MNQLVQSAIGKPRTEKRGRPRGSGTIKKPERKSTIPAKISPELWALVMAQGTIGESMSDTIMRLIRQNVVKWNEARKKVDALEERLYLMKSQSIIQRGS